MHKLLVFNLINRKFPIESFTRDSFVFIFLEHLHCGFKFSMFFLEMFGKSQNKKIQGSSSMIETHGFWRRLQFLIVGI